MKFPVEHKDVGPKTKLAAIEWYQQQMNLHPLTCGNDSTHHSLVGRQTRSGGVYLECIDCTYIQDWIPQFVWRLYLYRLALGASRVQAPYGHVNANVGEV